MAKNVAEKRGTGTERPKNSGKFVKGNTAGRKSRGKRVAHKKKIEFAEIFKAAISYQDIKDIAAAMVDEAKDGNVKAAQLIMDRCCGKPAPQSRSNVETARD